MRQISRSEAVLLLTGCQRTRQGTSETSEPVRRSNPPTCGSDGLTGPDGVAVGNAPNAEHHSDEQGDQ